MSEASTIQDEVSYLEMSDEELMALDPSTINLTPEVTIPDEEDAPKVLPTVPAETVVPVVVPAEEDPDEQEDESLPGEPGAKAGETPAEPVEAAPVEEKGIDYKAEYERLLAPFKANGREIAINGVDDAVALMQMGANYNKKMSALKPSLKVLKLLENSGLLSEEKISFLIDLDKKDPAAISKLVKDSGIDPLDFDAEKASGYVPKTHLVDDRELELDTVLDSIQDTPTYNRTLEIVSSKWDGASKKVIADAPQLLKVINDHVQSGIYDAIIKEVDRERVFGRLNGLSDIEAYRQVGDAIQARGGFDQLVPKTATERQPVTPEPVVVEPKPKKVDDDKLREKKRAASSPRPAVSTPAAKDFNPLALSDEEFSKTVNQKFL